MDAAIVFARLITGTKFEDLPKNDVEAIKIDILDSLGAMIGGSTTEKAAGEIVAMVKEAGGKKESRIISYGGEVPSWMAAFANGAMAHVLDYEDTHDASLAHVGGCTLPAALAAADAVGGITGKEFMTAFALGGEILIRLGLARIHPSAWYLFMLPSVFGTFSSTAAASRICKLSEDQVINAFGFALQQAAGSWEVNFDPGSHVRAIRDAFSAKAGMLSALLAKRGIRAARNSLEGKAGLLNMHLKGEYDPVPLTNELGKYWHIAELSFKPWPSSRWTHAHIDAAIRILEDEDIKPEHIEEITGVIGISGTMMFDPIEKKRRPETGIDAKASLPFTLAIAALRRKLVIADFLEDALRDPAVLEMANRVNYRFEEDADTTSLRPGIIEIKTKDGKLYKNRIDYPYGHPKNPLSTNDIIAKFKDCSNYSAKPMTNETINEVIDLLMNLEKVNDIKKVITLVS